MLQLFWCYCESLRIATVISMRIVATYFPVLVGALLTCAPASAHHSYAMFDSQHELTLKGTVKAFQWNNPHCFIQVLVSQGKRSEEWSVEMGSPMLLLRNGWKPGSLKPGDVVTVTLHPVRDGGKGGSYMSIIGPDGKPIGTTPHK